MNIGVVGFGKRIREILYTSLKEVYPDFHVTGIVDPDEKGARERLLSDEDKEKVVFYDTLDEMVRKAKIDILCIGTRCDLHTPYAIQAAKYDIPLLLEKPVAINMEQALELEKAFENTKCRVVVSFPLRLSTLGNFTKNMVDNGVVGDPMHVMAWNYVPYGAVYWEQGYRNYDITQGLFIQKATHDFDYIMYVLGMPILRVGTMATFQKVFGGKKAAGLVCSKCNEAETCLESPENRMKNRSGYHTGDHPCVYSIDCGTVETGTNEDASSAVFELPSGRHGVYTQVFFTRRDAHARGLTISGYMGTLKLEWYESQINLVRHHQPFSEVINTDKGLPHFGGDLDLAREMVKVVRHSDYTSIAPIETGIASVYVCLAAKESYQTGKFVNVRQVGQV